VRSVHAPSVARFTPPAHTGIITQGVVSGSRRAQRRWRLTVRCKLSAETPSLAVANSQQAVNQTVSGVRVRPKIVPAVTDVRKLHPTHMNRPSPSLQPPTCAQTGRGTLQASAATRGNPGSPHRSKTTPGAHQPTSDNPRRHEGEPPTHATPVKWRARTPSMPAVLRPALRSVTRRTLKRALARARNINFCKLRTLLRSAPACDAVKMRWRRRRTWSSTWCQSIDSQSSTSSSGGRPLITTVGPWCLTCPSVRVSSSIVYLTGSPDPRQHPLGSK